MLFAPSFMPSCFLSDSDLADDVLEAISTVMQSSKLCIVERQEDLALCAVVADNIQKAETYIVDAVFAVQHRGNCHCCVDTCEDALNNVANGNGNCVVGSTLALDNASAGLANIALDLIVIKSRHDLIRCEDGALEVSYRDIGDVCKRPRNEGAVAVLAENISMNIELVDVEVLGETCTQTSCIQNSTGADDAGFRNAGALAEGICEDIDRIADDDVCSIRSVTGDIGNDALDDIYVCLCEVQSGLTRLTCNTGSDDNNIGALTVRIATCINRGRCAERCTLTNIKCFAKRLIVIDVYHNDLGSETHDSKCVSYG